MFLINKKIMFQSSFLVLSSLSGIAFFIRFLSSFSVLVFFITYQLLFSQFITPSLSFMIYSLCAVVSFINIVALLFYQKSSFKSLFLVDSLFLFGLVLALGFGGVFALLPLAFFQILAFSFYQDRLNLMKFVLWLSFLFSLGLLLTGDILNSQRIFAFTLIHLSLGLGFIVGDSLIFFLKENILKQKIPSVFNLGERLQHTSLSVAVRLSKKFKPAFRSLVEFLESSTSDTENFFKKKESISYQIKQLNKLQHLTEKLEQLEAPLSISLSSININDVIRETTQKLLSHTERPSFLKEVLELNSLGLIRGSTTHLQDAFTEIFVNSFQSLKKSKEPELQIKTCNKDNKILLEILDNGFGAEREDIPFLLEPFFSRKLGKSGLGFSVALKIIKAHEGSLSIDDSISKGFKVVMSFPCLLDKHIPENRLIA